MKIRLKKIDLRKGRDHEHPDIREDREYLARINGVFHAGQFSRQHYGWNFDGWRFNPGVGLQYDQPGTNASDWQDLWEIIPQKKARGFCKVHGKHAGATCKECKWIRENT